MAIRRSTVWLGIVLACGILSSVAAAEGAEATSKFDMSKGGPSFTYGNTSVTMGLFTQIKFQAEDKEEFDSDAAGTTGFGVEDGVSTGFKIPRIRLSLRGTLLQPWFKYGLSYELSDTSGERDAKFKDAFVEFAKMPMASVRFGQYKVPFSLQELCGDQSQLFPERAITNTLSVGREMGVAMLGRTGNQHFAYQAGAFNGSGESRSQDDEGMMYVARVVFDPFEEYKLTETAQEMPEKQILHFGAAYRTGEGGRGFDAAGVVEDPNNQDAFNLEFGWKWRRWYATAEFFQQTTESVNPIASAAPDVDSDGYHVQGSYMAIPKKLEFGLRYAVVDGNTDLDDAETTEIRGVMNYYWWGDNLKVHFDLGTLSYEANAPGRFVNGVTLDTGTRLVPGEVTDLVARVQVQFGF